MREINYLKISKEMIDPEIADLLAKIHEFKGEQNMYLNLQADTLKSLLEIAKIQSVEASNKIEGICTSDNKIRLLALDKTTAKNRDEKEIAGYRDVLRTIHENYKYIYLNKSYILQFHRDLYNYTSQGYGGKFKSVDNVITEETESGEKRIRFVPLESWETSSAIEEICEKYTKAVEQEGVDALLAIFMWVLDFTCIHPFNNGNGRMSRLLTLLLLYKAGYNVGKYISIEKKIENTKEQYYNALQLSSVGWKEGENDYKHFVKYMLSILLACYRDFNERVNVWNKKPLTKSEQVADIIKSAKGTLTKTEIVKICFPDIAEITVQRTLAELVEKGDITKIGGGRYTRYIWNKK